MRMGGHKAEAKAVPSSLVGRTTAAYRSRLLLVARQLVAQLGDVTLGFGAAFF